MVPQLTTVMYPRLEGKEMFERISFKAGDALIIACSDPKCESVHRLAVKSVDGTSVEVVSAESPHSSAELEQRGNMLDTGRTTLPIKSVEAGGGASILDEHQKLCDLVLAALEASYSEAEYDQACLRHQKELYALDALQSDPRVTNVTEIAQGVCRLAGIEPSETLIVLLGGIISASNQTSVTFEVVASLPEFRQTISQN